MPEHTLEVRRKRVGAGLAVVLGSGALVALSGCFVYVPASVETVPVGSHVRVALSPEASSQSDRGVRAGAESISGKLLKMEAQDLVLLVESGSSRPAFHSQAQYREVTLAPQDVTGVEVKRLQALRTGAAIAALAGSFTVLVLTVRGEPGLGDTSPSGGIDEHLGGWFFWGQPLRQP